MTKNSDPEKIVEAHRKNPVSHIMIISNEFKITDLGNYKPQNIRPIKGSPNDGLIIESPEQERINTLYQQATTLA
ncbi:MAG: hypothetical protein PHW62_00370 [Candidatus Ratteibacteria bacterium]|nr:hypothetical protein [Candidatus Ratteibacteria bacterium]